MSFHPISIISNIKINKIVNNVAVSQGCCKLKLCAISNECRPINARMNFHYNQIAS